jgi:hypothetical protein
VTGLPSIHAQDLQTMTGPQGRWRRQPTVPDWRYVAAGAAVFSILTVSAGAAGAVAHADSGDGTSSASDSGSTSSASIGARSGSTSLRRTVTTSDASETRDSVTDGDDADSSAEPRSSSTPASDDASASSNDEQLDHEEASTDDASSDPISTEDPSPQDGTTNDPGSPSPDPSPAPTVPEDTPTDPTPPAHDTGSTTGPGSSTPEPDSSSGGALPSAPVIPSATPTDGPTTGSPAEPVGTVTVGDPAPTTDSTPVAADSPAAGNAAGTVGQSPLPAAQSSVVAPVAITPVSVTVPLTAITAVAPPPDIVQWFVLLTWYQLQWLVQQLSGPGAAPGLSRLDANDPRLISTALQDPSATAFLATQLPWLQTALGGLPGVRLVDLPVDQSLLHTMSTGMTAGAASLPVIAKALTDRMHSILAPQDGSPCIATFIRNVSVWALFTAAALGIFGLIGLTGLGAMVGFRQAKAGFALQATGLARFAGPGPLGVVRQAGFVQIGSRRASARPPRPRAVGRHLRDIA